MLNGAESLSSFSFKCEARDQLLWADAREKRSLRFKKGPNPSRVIADWNVRYADNADYLRRVT